MGTVGKIIDNPLDLFKYKSVYVKAWNRPCSTSFLISMQFRSLAMFMRYGIFEYTPSKDVKFQPFAQEVTNG